MVATKVPVAVEIFYPPTDDMPMPDSRSQGPVYRKIVRRLEAHFKDDKRTDVNGDSFIYLIEGDRRTTVAPDGYVVFGLSDAALESLERRDTYLLWEVGKFPEFILEIGSRSTAEYDMGGKRDLYARLGASEYWRHDPTGGEHYDEPLVGERLVNGEYVRLDMRCEDDGSIWAHSDVLNLDLWWIEGELQIWDPAARRWLPNLEESETARAEAESRANAEAARADSEAGRADAAEEWASKERAGRLDAESRAAQLEAKLRRLLEGRDADSSETETEV